MDWYEERNSRSILYAGRVLDPKQWITIEADPDYVSNYDGQVAILTIANLLGRMSPSIAFDLPSVAIVDPLPNRGNKLNDTIQQMLEQIDPFGSFEFRRARTTDFVIFVGRQGRSKVVHGSGWNSFCGDEPSPIAKDSTLNPIGPAMAVILAISQAFRTNLTEPSTDFSFNALHWTPRLVDPTPSTSVTTDSFLGNMWTVGTGSVGTSILYFLSLATNKFSGALFDMDSVECHNLDRSPIFTYQDLGRQKTTVTQEYLSRVGVRMKSEPVALDESELWKERKQGIPDIVITAANERNVRTIVETGFPPIQIYGTTGQNWQATVLRHIPMRDPCSRCVFSDSQQEPTVCATCSVVDGSNKSTEPIVDAALPFLSFAAGTMAASEILKLQLPEYPFNANRVLLYTNDAPRVVPVPLRPREHCNCRKRSDTIHKKVIDGSRYASLVSS